MRISRVLFVTGLIALLLTSVTACGANDVAARVNGEEISKTELDEQVATLREQSPQMFEGAEGEERALDISRNLLESMIDTILVRQAAEERGITVTGEEVEEQITQLRNGFPSEEEFNTALSDAGLTLDELRDQVRDQLVTRRLTEEIFLDESVEEAEIAAYYEANPAEFTDPPSTRSSHILFTSEERDLAEQVLAEVRANGDFAALAREHSEDPGSAARGGDLGWSTPAQPFVPEFTVAMDQLGVGEVSDLVETEFGWHIIRVEERRDSTLRPLADVTDQIEDTITQQRNTEAYQAFLAELRANATIEYVIDELRPVESQ